MDDDLMSLRGSGSGDTEAFSGFSDPAGADLGGAEAASRAEETPDWLRELGGFEEEETKAAPARTARKGKAKSSGRRAAGMTPQQRMILSIFLFLDVAVLGCAILFALGVISF
jgi:hypothetical protein